MKILMIMPDAKIHRLDLGFHKMSFREAPLTLTTLAALVPPELNAHIRLVDESIDPQDWNTFLDYDLICISAMTGTSVGAFKIADFFRGKGVKVVIGGVHVTMMPDQARPHADAIMIGYGERIWPILLKDFVRGEMKSEYIELGLTEELMVDLPTPRRDLQKKFGYAMPNTVMATRGCGHYCDFCSVPVICQGYHKRPIEDIVREVRLLKGRRFTFNDVNLLDDIEWSKKLLEALIPLKKIWGGLATFEMYKNKEIMDLLRKSGCRYLLVGIESITQAALTKIAKGFNQVENYREGMKVFHDHGILIQGCFVFGLDHDTPEVFKETVDWVNDLKIDIPRYAIMTPYPGTRVYDQLEREGRLLSKDFELYDTQHVVFQPKGMSPDELYRGFKWAYKETFKLDSIVKRTARASRDFPIAFVGNLAYRIYVKRLYGEDTYDRPEFYTGLSEGTECQ